MKHKRVKKNKRQTNSYKKNKKMVVALCSKKLFQLIFTLAIITFVTTIFYIIFNLPDIDKIKTLNKTRQVTIVDINGYEMTNFGDIYGQYTSLDSLPQHFIDALIATEDRKFFSHFGVDVFGLMRAMINNFIAGRVVQGGSTITQQLAKNVFLSFDKTYKRKLQELLLALLIEYKFSKEEILEAYINRVYFGSGIYGISAASKYYFLKEVSELNIKESAVLVGMLKAPNKYSPSLSAEKTAVRANQVIQNMRNNKMISVEQEDLLDGERIFVDYSAKFLKKQSYFANWIYEQINDLELNDNLIINTSLNVEMQTIVENSLNNMLKNYYQDSKKNQAAIIIMNKEGQILSMIGGRDVAKSSFNRATQAKRQPGSAFKHIVYAAAYEEGYKPSDLAIDEPINIQNWQPRNSNRKYHGEMTLEEAFVRSINTITAQIGYQVGIKKVVETAKQMGIKSNLAEVPSITLGSVEVNLLELVSSYAIFINNGYSVDPYGIVDIYNQDHEEIYKYSSFNKKVLKNSTIQYIRRGLHKTINQGSGFRAKPKCKCEYGGKTGTSQNSRDSLFVGYANNLVIGVWLGNDDDTPTNTGGSRLPALIWREIVDNLCNNGFIK